MCPEEAKGWHSASLASSKVKGVSGTTTTETSLFSVFQIGLATFHQEASLKGK